MTPSAQDRIAMLEASMGELSARLAEEKARRMRLSQAMLLVLATDPPPSLAERRDAAVAIRRDLVESEKARVAG